MVKIIEWEKVKKGDILLLPCEPGEEEKSVRNIHSKLFPLLLEKEAYMLAIGSDYEDFEIYQAIDSVKAYKQTDASSNPNN